MTYGYFNLLVSTIVMLLSVLGCTRSLSAHIMSDGFVCCDKRWAGQFKSELMKELAKVFPNQAHSQAFNS